jgi:hypothetical protein
MNIVASMELYSYWNELRGDTPAPVRQNIEPEKIRHLLPDLFILSDEAETSPVFRLTGTRLYSIFGRELHKTAFSKLWLPQNAGTMVTIAKTVMQREIPAILTVRGVEQQDASDLATQSPDDDINYEMLLLPLRSSHPSEPRLIGGLFPQNRKHVYIRPVASLNPETCRILESVSTETALKNHA